MSQASYIRGFTKTAEAYGINPVLLLKVAQWESISDGYFQYNPMGKGRYAVNDIYYELYPELEESMTDFSGRSNPESKLKPARKWTVRNGSTPQPQVKSAPVTKPRQPAAILKDLGLTPDKVRAMSVSKPAANAVKSVTPAVANVAATAPAAKQTADAAKFAARLGRITKALKRIR